MPFVWSVLGDIARATERLCVGIGVICPPTRSRAAVIARAAATIAAMMPGHFFLGVGPGENLDERILGDRLSAHNLRLARLEEAVGIIRQFWQGGVRAHEGADHASAQ